MSVTPTAVAVPLLAAVSIGAAGAALVAHTRAEGRPSRAAVVSPAPAAAAVGLSADIERLQSRLRQVPRDWESWATLGFDYVQQARVTVDPSYYPKAQQALSRSLRLGGPDNVAAMAGEAALAAARHDFRGALSWSRRGLAQDPRNGALLGALTDALTQLGDYSAAQRAAVAMENVDPGTGAEARLSYAAELRGDLATARRFMQLARDDAGSADDVAFTRYYSGDLAWNAGDARAALQQYDAGLTVAPKSTMLREGRARAEAALGLTPAALRDLASVVADVPMPSYVVEYGELLQASGQSAKAEAQYALVRTEEKLFIANGVALDSDAVLFEADHGNARRAVSLCRTALQTRPFLDTYDACGWALHRVGRDTAALRMLDRALSTDMRNALFHYHRGVVELALGQRAAGRSDIGTALRINPHFNVLAASTARRLLAAQR